MESSAVSRHDADGFAMPVTWENTPMPGSVTSIDGGTEKTPTFEPADFGDVGTEVADSEGERTAVSTSAYDMRAKLTGSARGAAIAKLQELADTAFSRREIGFAVVVGEPGMGKSRTRVADRDQGHRQRLRHAVQHELDLPRPESRELGQHRDVVASPAPGPAQPVRAVGDGGVEPAAEHGGPPPVPGAACVDGPGGAGGEILGGGTGGGHGVARDAEGQREVVAGAGGDDRQRRRRPGDGLQRRVCGPVPADGHHGAGASGDGPGGLLLGGRAGGRGQLVRGEAGGAQRAEDARGGGPGATAPRRGADQHGDVHAGQSGPRPGS
jgi:hypothetical protein